MVGFKLLSKEDKEARFQFYGLVVFIGLVFWLQARFLLFINLPLTFFELVPYAGISIFLFYLYSYAPLKAKNKSQGKVQALDYADSMVRRGKKKPDDIMLPFKEVYEIPIDFEDNGSLTATLKSNTYKKHHISYLESQITPNVSEDEKVGGNTLQTLLDVLTPKLQDMREKGVLENLIKSDVDEKKSKTDRSKNEEPEIIEESVDQDKKVWDINKVDDDGKEILKSLNIYWVLLDSPQNYDNEKEEWDQLYIVIPNFSYKETMATGKGNGFYNDWPVILKECFCYWMHLWDLTGEIQVLYLIFSENFDKPYLEPLKNLKAEAYAFLQLKVMEVYMNDLEVKPERLEKTMLHYREKSRALGDTLSNVVQDEAADNIIFSKYLNNPAQKQLLGVIEKYKRRFILALCGIVIAVLSMGFIIAIVL